MVTSRMVGQIGRVVGGRYRLLAPVGTGASADVFVADDVTLRRRVAVKVLHAALAHDDSFLRRFRAEARTVAGLRHPNIMGVFDWGEEEDGPYLVLELLSGGSLRDLLDRGHRLSPSQALLVGLEAARALDYAHRRGLVHRDIKPANLLFDDEGRLCVADFGIARALAEATWTEPTGAVVGTVRYASPEQARGNSVDGKADVYALALVLIEAVTGQVPFSADTTIATLMGRLDRPIPVPDGLGSLGEALGWAGALDPADRLDAGGLVAALDDAARRLPRPAPLPLAPLEGIDLTAPIADPTALGPASPSDVRPRVPHPGVFDALADPTVALDLGPAASRAGDHTAVFPAVNGPAAPTASVAVAAGASGPPAVEAPAERPRRRRWWWFALAVLVAALAAGGGYAATRLLAPKFPVPAVTSAELAGRVSLPHGFKARVHHVRRDNTTAGQILGQTPRPGTKEPKGTVITVDVSDGQTVVAVPSLQGLTKDAATAALTAAGFPVGHVDTPYSDTVPAGQIVSWSPQGNQVKGTAIDLVVSNGKQPIPVPDVSNLSLADAQAKLTAAGLTQLTSDQVYSDTVQSGNVVGTDPPAGANGRDQTITIHVSKGPQVVSVPDVTGQTVQQAGAALTAAGLQVGNIYGPPKARRVLFTSPLPGSHVNHGSSVDLYVG